MRLPIGRPDNKCYKLDTGSVLAQEFSGLSAACEGAEFLNGLDFDLPDSFACNFEFLAEFISEAGGAIIVSESVGNDPSLSVSEEVKEFVELFDNFAFEDN